MRLPVLLTLLFLLGCAHPVRELVVLKPIPRRPPRAIEQVTLLGIGERPACDYVVVAIVEGRGGTMAWNADIDVAARHVRERVAAWGLDGVIDLRCVTPNYVASNEPGRCAGQAYYCRRLGEH